MAKTDRVCYLLGVSVLMVFGGACIWHPIFFVGLCGIYIANKDLKKY